MTVNTKTLTSADVIFRVRCKGLFDQYVTLNGFQPDNSTSFGDRTIAETRMGIDGKLSGGKVNNTAQFTAYFEPNSNAQTVMDQYLAYNANPENDALVWDIDVTYPSIKKRYAGSGFLVTTPSGVTAQKMLAGTQFVWDMDNFAPEDIA